jgi:hypothetical protein
MKKFFISLAFASTLFSCETIWNNGPTQLLKDIFTITGTRPGSKMKCNALECLLKIQAQKGVANEKVPSINSMGKNKDSDVKAIGVLINEDCRSA